MSIEKSTYRVILDRDSLMSREKEELVDRLIQVYSRLRLIEESTASLHRIYSQRLHSLQDKRRKLREKVERLQTQLNNEGEMNG